MKQILVIITFLIGLAGFAQIQTDINNSENKSLEEIENVFIIKSFLSFL